MSYSLLNTRNRNGKRPGMGAYADLVTHNFNGRHPGLGDVSTSPVFTLDPYTGEYYAQPATTTQPDLFGQVETSLSNSSILPGTPNFLVFGGGLLLAALALRGRRR